MQLILLFRLLNWLADRFPAKPEPPHLSRWDLLMIQVKQRKEREAAEERERAQRANDALPPPQS